MHYTMRQFTLKDNQLVKQPPHTVIPKQNHIAIVIHLFYNDIWDEEIKPYLDAIKIPHDTYVTIPKTIPEEIIIKILQNNQDITFYETENRGRDVLPFLQVMHHLGTDSYQYVCKIHTKKSAGRDLGTVWRKLLYFDLIGSNGTVSDIIDIFEEDKNIGMITGKNTILDSEKYYLSNRKKTDKLLKLLNLELKGNYQFAGGTMFWIRPNIIEPLIKLYHTGQLVFESELGQMDDTLAHAIERFLGILCHTQHKTITGSPALYTQLSDTTLNEVAALVLSQTYRGKEMFLQQKRDLFYKDKLIESKTEEIIAAHEGMVQRDQEIQKTHLSLSEAIALIQEKDKQLDLKDRQINLKDKQIAFLTDLTLKKRIKQKIKKIIPNALLTLLGFEPYHALVLPQDDTHS